MSLMDYVDGYIAASFLPSYKIPSKQRRYVKLVAAASAAYTVRSVTKHVDRSLSTAVLSCQGGMVGYPMVCFQCT